MITENAATLEDKALITMVLAGQTECFSALMDRHATTVKKLVASMVNNEADVEDIVQNTFMKAWLSLSSFRFESSWRAWLAVVARNEALAYYRSCRRRPSLTESANLEQMRCSGDSPEEALVRFETNQTLHLAIAKLPPKYRQVINLCDIEQLTAPETAERLKRTVALVKTRRFRARNMLATALKNDIQLKALKSAKGTDACLEAGKEIRFRLRGTLDAVPVLREALKTLAA